MHARGQLWCSGLYVLLLAACQVRDGEDAVPEAAPPVYNGQVILHSVTGLTATEGGVTASFAVSLSKAPGGTLNLAVGEATGQVSVSPATLSFNAQNWQLLQQVTLTAVDDAVVEGSHGASIALVVSGDDPEFMGIVIPQVPVNIADNDAAGITLTITGGNTTVTEAGITDQVFIALSAAPQQDVALYIDNPVPGRITVTPAFATFTPTNWGGTVAFTVSATNDAVHQGNLAHVLTARTVSTQTLFHNLTQTFTVQVTDND